MTVALLVSDSFSITRFKCLNQSNVVHEFDETRLQKSKY